MALVNDFGQKCEIFSYLVFCGKIQEEMKFCVILGRKEVFLDCKNTLQAPAV